MSPNDKIGVTQDDIAAFELMFSQVQAAYGAEDYASLRKLTIPEVSPISPIAGHEACAKAPST